MFISLKVRFDAQNGLTLTMSRDVQEKRMLSGALYTKAEIGEGGKYKVSCDLFISENTD